MEDGKIEQKSLLVVLVVLLLVLILILLLVRLLLDLALQSRSGDSVQVTPKWEERGQDRQSAKVRRIKIAWNHHLRHSLSVNADLPSTVSGLLEHTDLLQRLEDGPLNTGSGVLVVRGPVSTSVGTSVELGESTDTDVLPEVDVSGDRG